MFKDIACTSKIDLPCIDETKRDTSFVGKRLPHCESPSIESICIELTISKRKWCILLAQHPSTINKGEFFKEISNTLSKALKCYDNIVLAGDFNIDLLDPSKDTSCLTKGL